MRRRHHADRDPDDDAIDLSDRLAPYAHAAFRPRARETAPAAPQEEPLFTPLELDFPYRTG